MNSFLAWCHSTQLLPNQPIKKPPVARARHVQSRCQTNCIHLLNTFNIFRVKKAIFKFPRRSVDSFFATIELIRKWLFINCFRFTFQQKERDRQRSAAKKFIHNNQAVPEKKNNRKTSAPGETRGEFDDLISALRTGDVFGDELSKMKGRRRTAPPKQARIVEKVSERERASPKLNSKFWKTSTDLLGQNRCRVFSSSYIMGSCVYFA